MFNVAMWIWQEAERGVPTVNLIVLGVLIVIAIVLLMVVMKKRRARE